MDLFQHLSKITRIDLVGFQNFTQISQNSVWSVNILKNFSPSFLPNPISKQDVSHNLLNFHQLNRRTQNRDQSIAIKKNSIFLAAMRTFAGGFNLQHLSLPELTCAILIMFIKNFLYKYKI